MHIYVYGTISISYGTPHPPLHKGQIFFLCLLRTLIVGTRQNRLVNNFNQLRPPHPPLHKGQIFFLMSAQNIDCGYSPEPLRQRIYAAGTCCNCDVRSTYVQRHYFYATSHVRRCKNVDLTLPLRLVQGPH